MIWERITAKTTCSWYCPPALKSDLQIRKNIWNRLTRKPGNHKKLQL